jgi:hypothetical protein
MPSKSYHALFALHTHHSARLHWPKTLLLISIQQQATTTKQAAAEMYDYNSVLQQVERLGAAASRYRGPVSFQAGSTSQGGHYVTPK